VKCGKKMLRHLTHSCILENGICKSSDGRTQNITASLVNPPTMKNGFIKHYGTKSIEEYIIRRCAKNQTDVAFSKVQTPENRIKWFFNVNEDTPEKRQIIKEMLG
jgi:hypothetical protein